MKNTLYLRNHLKGPIKILRIILLYVWLKNCNSTWKKETQETELKNKGKEKKQKIGGKRKKNKKFKCNRTKLSDGSCTKTNALNV